MEETIRTLSNKAISLDMLGVLIQFGAITITEHQNITTLVFTLDGHVISVRGSTLVAAIEAMHEKLKIMRDKGIYHDKARI